MTLCEFCEEVQEMTHAGELEVLDLARRNWPTLTSFSKTQVRLAVALINKEIPDGSKRRA